MTPPLKWHGGKRYLAAHIHKLASQTTYTHRVITHGGGAAELWDWPYQGISEVLNDINGDLTNFWRVLASKEQFPIFLRQVQATPFSQIEWRNAKATLPNTQDPVSRAVLFFILCRQSMAGRMQSFSPISRTRTRRGMNEQVSSWLTAIDGLPQVHARLSRILILNDDAISVIRSQDSPQTLFYCDPPYHPDTRTSPNVYAHELTPTEHRRLLNIANRITGKMIISHYRHPLYDKLLSNWNCLTISLPNNAASGRTKRRMTECLYYNF